MAYVSDALRRLIIERAAQSCAYCLLPNSLSFYPHEVEHVIAIKHQGETIAENLAYVCWRCNRFKGSDLGSFEDFMAMPPSKGHAMLKQLEKALDENVHERKAMELAMKEEEDLVKNLQMTASRIVDPSVRGVFERMARETENHYAIIESEYARMMGMVHETDIDTYVRE